MEGARWPKVASFNDYHSHIARQVALVDELIAAVAREEGEKYGNNNSDSA